MSQLFQHFQFFIFQQLLPSWVPLTNSHFIVTMSKSGIANPKVYDVVTTYGVVLS